MGCWWGKKACLNALDIVGYSKPIAILYVNIKLGVIKNLNSSFICSNWFIIVMVAVNLEPILGTLGCKVGIRYE